MRKPLIFITNDDGIKAPGLRALIEAVKGLGEIVVVAPENGMSGMSHALTVSTILRLKEVAKEEDYIEFYCTGTPVDCVKLGGHKAITRKPDLIVSGINHGSNSSINVIYSGTMAAAIEGAIQGIPSIGFSLLDHSENADFSLAIEYARKIAIKVLAEGLPAFTCLNVNFPKNHKNEVKGIKVCRQAMADWDDEYVETLDPHHHKYFWLTGEFANSDMAEDTDEWALSNNYISIVPVHTDYTNHKVINQLKSFEL
ncbi:MAG: 5'/3'-nucleotidase SurE [Bacteroidota bacterium]